MVQPAGKYHIEMYDMNEGIAIERNPNVKKKQLKAKISFVSMFPK